MQSPTMTCSTHFRARNRSHQHHLNSHAFNAKKCPASVASVWCAGDTSGSPVLVPDIFWFEFASAVLAKCLAPAPALSASTFVAKDFASLLSNEVLLPVVVLLAEQATCCPKAEAPPLDRSATHTPYKDFLCHRTFGKRENGDKKNVTDSEMFGTWFCKLNRVKILSEKQYAFP